MIKVEITPDSSISVASFTAHVLTKTDWQKWVELQGQKLKDDELMIITFESSVSVKVETIVGDVKNISYLEWFEFRDKPKSERQKLWQEQWKELDNMIIDFVGSND